MSDRVFGWLANHPQTADAIGRVADVVDLMLLCGLGVLSVYMLTR